MNKKLVILVTVPISLETWLKGQPHYLSQFYDIEIITSNGQNISQIEENENVKIKIIDFTRKINPIKDLKVIFHLWKYFITTKPDIVYTLTPKAGLLGMISSYFARVPIRIHNVVGLPHLGAKGIKKHILQSTEKLTYCFSTHLYSNSFNLREIIMSTLTSKQVHVVGHGSVSGVDTDYFKNTFNSAEKNVLKQTLNISSEAFVLTYIGRIVADKGINELIEAFNTLSYQYSNIRLLLIGDFEETSDLILPVNKDIIFHHNKITHLPFQKDIRPYLAITDVVVLPSYREGLPNVLIEAGSFGIPLIATNINGCNEVIINEKNGLLIEKKEVSALENAIIHLLTDKSFYEYIRSNARSSIVTRYDQHYFWNELHKEFERIIQKCM